MPGGRTLLWLAIAVLCAIVFATLGPEAWQVRLGLHWLVEHFLAYFSLTLLACLVWPRPMIVAAALLPVAVGLEAAQALTPDRTADVATALVAAAAVSLAALIADGVSKVRKNRGNS